MPVEPVDARPPLLVDPINEVVAVPTQRPAAARQKQTPPQREPRLLEPPDDKVKQSRINQQDSPDRRPGDHRHDDEPKKPGKHSIAHGRSTDTSIGQGGSRASHFPDSLVVVLTIFAAASAKPAAFPFSHSAIGVNAKPRPTS